MKLRAAILTSLLGVSSLLSAEDTQEHVNVNVTNGEGKVVIVKDGKTIEEMFAVDADTDIDDTVQAILTKHGIDQDNNKDIHKVTKMMKHQGKNMVWVQKSDDVNVNLENGQATVIIKKDNNGEVETYERIIEVDEDTDIDALVDEMMAEHGIEVGDAKVHRKVIKLDKHIAQIDSNKPRMGFMASVEDQGWKIVSVVQDSGAAEAGMAKGDVVISIDGKSTAKGGLGLTEFIAMDHKEGDVSEVMVLRDGKKVKLAITAKVLDSPDIIMELKDGNKWFSSSGNDFKFKTGDLDEKFEGLHVDVEHLEQMVEGLGDHNIRVVTTGDADAYFFAGSKMNQWLGKNHHFSTITESLGNYFGTTEGVLVLEVDQNNKLGLKDGDVIQSINGNKVSSPKEVIKIMSGFKSDEAIEIKIMREKETLYLES
ncbi:PDZ domain-containing protein [Marinicella litoralis]|uniref:PDZ domain-containing protein n=1 Tax=Marinicella litoralis TaxID=644220 RepID=A0A4R6XRY0_9GAMM|nr:PDZ domain-containing protein [Marinicella litoralis]TDR22672.1 PDZ domain-containing protein [Marinicella litoralis]